MSSSRKYGRRAGFGGRSIAFDAPRSRDPQKACVHPRARPFPSLSCLARAHRSRVCSTFAFPPLSLVLQTGPFLRHNGGILPAGWCHLGGASTARVRGSIPRRGAATGPPLRGLPPSPTCSMWGGGKAGGAPLAARPASARPAHPAHAPPLPSPAHCSIHPPRSPRARAAFARFLPRWRPFSACFFMCARGATRQPQCRHYPHPLRRHCLPFASPRPGRRLTTAAAASATCVPRRNSPRDSPFHARAPPRL